MTTTTTTKTTEEVVEPPLPGFLATSGKDPLHTSLSHATVMSSENHDGNNDDFTAEHKRRERAFMWHRRWAMPTYQMMKHQVQRTPGLDITVEDVDLLPWGHHTQRLNQAEYHRLQTKGLRELAVRKRSQSLEKDDAAAMAAARAIQQAEEEERKLQKAEQERKRQEQAAAEAAAKAAAEERERARRKAAQEEEEAAAAAVAAAEAARLRAQAEQVEKEKEERRQAQAAAARLQAEKERRLAAQRAAQEEQKRQELQRQKEAAEATRLAAEEQWRRRRQEPPAATASGKTPVERAYYWYDVLHEPTKENMLKAIQQTTGMHITASDVEALPWKAGGSAIDFPQLHDALHEATGKRPALKSEVGPSTPFRSKTTLSFENVPSDGLPMTPKSILSAEGNRGGGYWAGGSPEKHVSFTPRSTKGTLSPKTKNKALWHALDEKERQKRKAFGWYLTLDRPSKAALLAILDHTTGVGITADEVEMLPWDPSSEQAFVKEQHMVMPLTTLDDKQAEEKRQRQIARREKEDQERAKEAAALVAWKKSQNHLTPPIPGKSAAGDVTQAYRWYRLLGEPSKSTMLAVLEETDGVPLSAEQIEALPWAHHDQAVDHIQLVELLNEEANHGSLHCLNNKEDIDPAILAAILQAYREYKGLGMPKFITFTSLIDETQGLQASKEDVAQLPWDADKLKVDEDQMRELERLLADYMTAQKRQEAAKLKRAEERKQRREALAREAAAEKEKARAAAASAQGGKKHQDIPLFLRERVSLRELEFTHAKESGNHKGWEESRVLKAYAWYTRLTGPNRDKLKRLVAGMKECDIVPDDIDLLPWSPSGGWVDHIKIDELSGRRKDTVF